MATVDSSQQVYPGSEAQLDQSRMSEHGAKSSHDQFVKPPVQQEMAADSEGTGGYGDVSEEVPPHHTIHSDSELLPQPQSNSSVAQEAGEPANESYEDARATPAESHFDATKPDEMAAPNGAVYDGSSPFGHIRRDEEKIVHPKGPASTGSDEAGGDHTDVAAPIAADTNVTDRGYGIDQEDTSAAKPAVATEHPAKKEGFMAKMMEKLPGHHHKAPDSPSSVEVPAAYDESTGPVEHDSSTDSPKKGIMEKIKEKFPGHHASHPHATAV